MLAPDDVKAAWERAVAQWDDPARHEALISVVVQHGSFAWAAARYKERSGDPIADRQLDRVRKAAVATMFATASARKAREEPAPYRRVMLWLVLLSIMLVVGLVFTKIIRDSKPAPTPSAAPTGGRP